MMKTSSSSSRSYKSYIHLLVVILVPLGPVEGLLKEKTSYQGFRSVDPVLEVLNIRKIHTVDLKHCQAEVKKIAKYKPGVPMDQFEWALGPWSIDDLKAIEKCNRFPCDIKLNEAEAKLVISKEPDQRKEEWEKIVRERLKKYLATGERLPYLYPKDPVDPWKWFKNMGFTMNEKPKRISSITVRKLQFSAKKMRPLRQVLDTRIETTANISKVWIRDIYTTHYFDAWGELLEGECDPQGVLTVVQSLVVDFDLLKKTDILSVLGKGKMRSAIEENGHKYLDSIFEKLKIEEKKESE